MSECGVGFPHSHSIVAVPYATPTGGNKVMRSSLVLVFSVLACAVIGSACATDVPPASEATTAESVEAAEQEINDLLDTYIHAVEGLDFDLFLTLWANPDDASLISPASRLSSRPELEGFFQDLRNAYTELRLEPSNVSVGIEGSAAWAAYDWELTGTFADGSPAKFSGWETQVYRRTDAGWRIVHLHYSVPFVVPDTP